MTISLPRNPRRASSYVPAPDDVRVYAYASASLLFAIRKTSRVQRGVR